MIRFGLLYVFVGALMVLSVRRWFWALCGLLLLTVFTQHPSMVSNAFGVQGANPWNLTLAVIAFFWLITRREDHGAHPVPVGFVLLVAAYMGMIVFTAVSAAVDGVSLRAVLGNKSIAQWLLVDGMVNPLKYLLMGVMFYDGARTRDRVYVGLFFAVGSAMCYAFLMFKSMGAEVFTIDFEDARRMTDKLIGLFANDIGELLAFTFWAAVALTFLLKQHWQRALWIWAIVAMVPPFISLKSRAGFLAFLVVGFALGLLRWRRGLVLLIVGVMLVPVLVPSVRERVLTGIESGSKDWDEITAGRLTNIWPPVIKQIGQQPYLGHGRYAILREDCATEIIQRERTLPGHPHNSYLEILLDAGMIGLVVCLALMALIARAAWELLKYKSDMLTVTLGTVALAAVLAELSAGIAGSSFFPTQSMVPYLCVWGMTLRVYHQLTAPTAAPQPLWRAKLFWRKESVFS